MKKNCQLYPLQFTPLFKHRIWGGNKLKTVLNKEYNQDKIGESWEISDVKGDETTICRGVHKGKTLSELITEYKGEIVGNKNYAIFGTHFPLLIKFIDAEQPLSIQVHPSNELAKERHNSFGKNEMWYVMQAEKDAKLTVGLNKKISKEHYKKLVKEDKLIEVLNEELVQKGDVYYIPTGRIHAIGAGVLLAEIQQTSDVTYRIYDYNRVDALTGKERDLHTDLAVDAIDYDFYEAYKTDYSAKINNTATVVQSPYFTTNIIVLKEDMNKDYSQLDSFVIYLAVEGSFNLECEGVNYIVKQGETILLAACLNYIQLKSANATILEVFL